MNSTFKLRGDGRVGTVFILGRPQKTNPVLGEYVLITAHHVLDTIKADFATLFLRQPMGTSYRNLPEQIQIRDNGKPLWVKHPEVDVAAMLISIPVEARFTLLSTNYLATDSVFRALEIAPGDELNCLGFPFGIQANDAGFPILRSGKIASYPLVPASEIKTFLLDFEVFGGYSGGPVYYYAPLRLVGGGLIPPTQFIAGLATKQRYAKEKVTTSLETREIFHSLGLAIIVNAHYILETINMLPNN
jgi:hypothetical protein